MATLKIVLDDSSFVFNDTNVKCATTEQSNTTKSSSIDKPSSSVISNDCEKASREMKKDELKEK